MGKNIKVMPQNAPYISNPMKTISPNALSDLPPAHTKLEKASMMHLKIAQK